MLEGKNQPENSVAIKEQIWWSKQLIRYVFFLADHLVLLYNNFEKNAFNIGEYLKTKIFLTLLIPLLKL